MSSPAELSLAEAARALRERRLDRAELLEACLARIRRWQPRLNAFVALDERPRNERAGALAGIPLAHKDMFYRAGRVSNCGSKIRRGWVADRTAAVLERLDRAGALDLGTLNMAEFAYGPTGHNEHWGDCCNPWDPECITGGSSSGSGAAVAARLVFGALGSDTGGSVRLPAAACGITGVKTTWGRVSRHGAMPLSFSLDTIGPLARSAEDCAFILREIAGRDERDALTAEEAVPDYVAELEKRRSLRIALSTTWIEREAHPEIAKAVLDAARAMQAAGMTLVEMPAPEFDLLSTHCLTVMQAEASAQHAQWMRERPQDYGPAVRARLEAGFAIAAADYLEVLRLRAAWLERFCASLGAADAYLLPAIAVPVPTREATGARGGPGMPRLLADVTRLTRWVNYLGVPAAVAPCGFDARGLPIAIQLVARPFGEATLLAAVHAYQRETDWHRRVPPER